MLIKYLGKILVFSTLLGTIFPAFGQKMSVKEKYAESNGTTVVIKDDKASDVDILNQQFNLDSFGMDEEVRITRATTPNTSVAPQQKERNLTTEEKFGYTKVYGAVPPPRNNKVKTKRRKVKFNKKRKKARGFCFAF
jgi:hypothetical protein